MAIPSILKTTSEPLLLSPFTTETAAVPKPKILDMRIRKQRQNNWCWAAVSVGIARAYKTARTQCELANTFLSTPQKPLTCCPPRSADCDQPFDDLERPLAPHHQQTHRPRSHRIFELVKDEIDNGHPIAVRIDWGNGGTGHAVVISGYLADRVGSSGHFYVWDPEWGDRWPWRFEEFRDRFAGAGTWDLSYTTTGPQGVPFE